MHVIFDFLLCSLSVNLYNIGKLYLCTCYASTVFYRKGIDWISYHLSPKHCSSLSIFCLKCKIFYILFAFCFSWVHIFSLRLVNCQHCCLVLIFSEQWLTWATLLFVIRILAKTWSMKYIIVPVQCMLLQMCVSYRAFRTWYLVPWKVCKDFGTVTAVCIYQQ